MGHHSPQWYVFSPPLTPRRRMAGVDLMLKNFRAKSSWVVSLPDFKLLLGKEDRPALCDDCRHEVPARRRPRQSANPRKGPIARPRWQTYVTWSELWIN